MFLYLLLFDSFEIRKYECITHCAQAFQISPDILHLHPRRAFVAYDTRNVGRTAISTFDTAESQRNSGQHEWFLKRITHRCMQLVPTKDSLWTYTQFNHPTYNSGITVSHFTPH